MTIDKIKSQNSLTREQKQAVGLLSVGTFLEYFDLMLYLHMAVLLNDLFFPEVDPCIKPFLTAATFCTTYVFRPFGALLFGWIGDTYGRKITVIITTTIMSISCLIMANLQTYSQIGIAATWIMMMCRILQGLSSMGEVVGALLYLTEFIKPPARYRAVATIPVFCDLGTICALGIGTLVTSFNFEWRLAFWIGACIAIVGSIARRALRETPEFADAKKRAINIQEKAGILSDKKYISLEKINKKSVLSLFLMECTWPLSAYFAFFYCGQLLKNNFGYSAGDVIQQNLIVALFPLITSISIVFLCKYFHPLIVLKHRFIISTFIFALTPICISLAPNGFYIGIIQTLIVAFAPDCKFVSSVTYKHFPIFSRFKSAAFLYALSRAFTYVVTSFGLIYLVDYWGTIGLFVAMMSTLLFARYGLNHFLSLEKKEGRVH
jgi:MFS family permease